MAENKFSKYLLYAIGEIALVVIGILIALSINNWNTERKERLLEQTYYYKILEDINQDIKQLEKHIYENEERLKKIIYS